MAADPLKAFRTHPFLDLLADQNVPTLTAAARTVGNAQERARIRADNRSRMSSLQRFQLAVMNRYSGLNEVLERQWDAIRLLRMYPRQLAKGSHPILRSSWVNYHFGQYTVSAASTLDATLQLVSEAARLGVAPRCRTYEVVTTHHDLAGTEIAGALARLKTSLRSHQERRNRHLHRGQGADVREVGDSEFLLDLGMITLVAHVNGKLIDQRMLSGAWRQALRELQPQLVNSLEDVVQAVVKVLDHSLPLYEQWVSAFSKTAPPKRLRPKRQ